MPEPTHVYRDKQGVLYLLTLEVPLPGRMWVVRCTATAKHYYIHESLLTPFQE